MPIVRSRLIDQGVNFTDAFVVNPLCCPSRTSILTGAYSHSTGIYTNEPPHGGFADFHDRSTIATWLDAAGYQNALVGKYLNGYAHTTYIPPGWDFWISQQTGEYYDYVLTHNHVLRWFGHSPSDYSTRVLTRHAVQFLRRAERPFFLYFAPSAPHSPAVPAPDDARAFPNLPPWRPASYDEANVSDKPAWVNRLHLSAAKRKRIDRFRRDQYRSLLAVDESVGRILDALVAKRQLHNTLIVFMSDNGLEWGEHRVMGKQDPYEETIRVPLVIRYDVLLDPAANGPRTDRHLVLNIDLAPTFAAAAGTRAPHADGMDLLPLLADATAPWRHDFLVEHERYVSDIPTYCAVRTSRYIYVVYATHEVELYDLTKDPLELRNRANDPAYARVRHDLRARLAHLCRPKPPGFDVNLEPARS